MRVTRRITRRYETDPQAPVDAPGVAEPGATYEVSGSAASEPKSVGPSPPPPRARHLSPLRLGPGGYAAYEVARRYAVRPGDEQTFADTWRSYRRFLDRNEEESAARITTAFADLDRALAGAGPLKAEHLPVQGRYVIFSDLHNTEEGHRQDAFGANRALYTQALSAYYDQGYTLVEDGDVEELVIWDPAHAEPGEAQRRSKMSLAELERARLQYRVEQLDRLLREPRQAEMWAAIERFHDSGRWVRLVGNHDVDEKRPELDAVMERRFPGFDAKDVLFLDGPDGRAEYAVMHGHQFDPWSNEERSAQAGETISENLAVWYEGSDKHWKLSETETMALGETALSDELVTAQPKSESHKLSELLAEKVIGHAIAWEYFENAHHPRKAVGEAISGERWLKARHTDEQRIAAELHRSPDRPKLVLGHTHEPRLDPLGPNGVDGDMLNCGSAGRFENLVFGLEIIDGVARVISWSMVNGRPERREWHVEDDAEGHRWLRAAPTPSDP